MKQREQDDLFNKPIVQIKVLTFVGGNKQRKMETLLLLLKADIMKNKEINNKIKEYTIDSLVFISRYNFKEKKKMREMEGFDILSLQIYFLYFLLKTKEVK